MTLDGFDFSYAYLANAHFNNLSMKGVNLSHAVLAGAQFDQANLQGSNMCNAMLQGNDEVHTAASLNGAYMKNVNLSGANLSGVSMINTAFYNTGALPCQASCDSSQMNSTCATAAGATMDGTQATPAYLARTDFSGIKTTGANFSGSILVGANFKTLSSRPIQALRPARISPTLSSKGPILAAHLPTMSLSAAHTST